MIINLVWLLAALAGGIALGAFYFGGLWWSVRRATRSTSPYVHLVLSFFVRAALVVSVLFLVTAGRWERIAACMIGFLLVRFVAVRLVVGSGRRVAAEVRIE